MNISGTTRVFMILGDPVEQVRAPEAFNHLFAKHGVDAVLVPAKVGAEHLDAFVRNSLLAQNIEGFWLTIPHKAAMVALLGECDLAGRVAGAVNAARRRDDGTLEGALFDGVGFVQALDHFAVPVRDRRVLVVGAGGAGMAIAASLAERGAAQVALYDPTPGRARSVAERVARAYGAVVVALDDADPSGCDLVVNATPLGLRTDDPLPLAVSRLAPDTVVVDILMKNQPTALLRACQSRGIRSYPGFEMLVQQVPLYLSFFGLDEVAQAVRDDATDVRAIFEHV